LAIELDAALRRPVPGALSRFGNKSAAHLLHLSLKSPNRLFCQPRHALRDSPNYFRRRQSEVHCRGKSSYDEEDGTLYWVDAKTNEIFSLDLNRAAADARPISFKVPEPIGVLALIKGDSEHLIAAAKRGFALIHKRTGDFKLINTAYPDEPELADKLRFNDGIVDSKGRFWAGTITDVRPSSAFRLVS
jgi:hypothetical protein